jgi:hypothetical protein
VLLGCQQREYTPIEPVTQVQELARTLSAVQLRTEADVQGVVSHAAACERAILFVNVDWAIMEPQQTRFAQFAFDWHETHPNDDVQFHYVDCTVTHNYGPLRSLAGWAELEKQAGGLIHGWGELVWMEKGRVLHVERILNFQSSVQLIDKTNALLFPWDRDG